MHVTFNAAESNIAPRKLYTCLNIIDISMFLLHWQMCWSCPASSCWLTHILGRVRNSNESERTTSFTFYLENNMTKLSLLAFPRREILEELLGTPGRMLELVAKEIERKFERDDIWRSRKRKDMHRNIRRILVSNAILQLLYFCRGHTHVYARLSIYRKRTSVNAAMSRKWAPIQN